MAQNKPSPEIDLEEALENSINGPSQTYAAGNPERPPFINTGAADCSAIFYTYPDGDVAFDISDAEGPFSGLSMDPETASRVRDLFNAILPEDVTKVRDWLNGLPHLS